MRGRIPERSPTPTSPSHRSAMGPSLSAVKDGEGKRVLPRHELLHHRSADWRAPDGRPLFARRARVCADLQGVGGVQLCPGRDVPVRGVGAGAADRGDAVGARAHCRRRDHAGARCRDRASGLAAARQPERPHPVHGTTTRRRSRSASRSGRSGSSSGRSPGSSRSPPASSGVPSSACSSRSRSSR